MTPMMRSAVSGRNRSIWFDDALWEAAELRSDQEGHGNTSMVVREATRVYCGLPKPDVPRPVPKRFLDALKIFPLLEKMSGDNKVQVFELSFENHLAGLYPTFGKAHYGIALLCTLLKRSARIQVIMDDLISAQRVDGLKHPQKRKDGFVMSFEYPVSAKNLAGYKMDIIKALKDTDIMEIIIQSEIKGKAPSVDESKALKEKIGTDDLEALAEKVKKEPKPEKDEDEQEETNHAAG